MKFLLGKKEKMTQIFNEEGVVIPVTPVKIDPATVIQLKTGEKDGYTAVQVGSGIRRAGRIAKAQQGHMKEMGSFATLRECRVAEKDLEALSVGDTIDLSVLSEGDTVSVTSTSKGKGFQGVVKRHGFSGGPRSHGQKHGERAPGSIGSTGPQRVWKGTRMAGRTGGDKVTVRNCVVVKTLSEEGRILIKGAIPGATGSLVELKG